MPKGVKGFQKGNKSWRNWKSRPDYSGKNNPNYGRKHTIEEIEKIKNKVKRGKEHKDWKGDKVGKAALHDYFRKRIPKPKVCPKCKKRKVIDLSNTGHTYKRNIKDWEWLCRSCHCKKDKSILKIKRMKKIYDTI